VSRITLIRVSLLALVPDNDGAVVDGVLFLAGRYAPALSAVGCSLKAKEGL
jgi:hypothetical protein